MNFDNSILNNRRYLSSNNRAPINSIVIAKQSVKFQVIPQAPQSPISSADRLSMPSESYKCQNISQLIVAPPIGFYSKNNVGIPKVMRMSHRNNP